MGWVDHSIWWQVYPLGFVRAPIRDHNETPSGEFFAGNDENIDFGSVENAAEPKSRLRRLLNWLDYAVELGASGLLLGPVFRSSTHGYDTLNQFQIDPRLGTEKDFDDLVAACKERGLRILLDGVFSHVGYHHPDVHLALAHGQDSPEAELFDIDWSDEDAPKPRVFEGHGSLVRLNHASQMTKEYVGEVMSYWLARGVDGWRLDAAYSVAPWFWAEVVPQVREKFPDAWFLGEVIHGDYPSFVEESTLDSVTQYELWKAIWSSILDGNLFELDWSLKRHNEFMQSFVPNTFVGNHDVTRITSTLDEDGAVTAFAILMTVGGIPSVYYGDEQGFTGIKEENISGDDAVRPPMPDSPLELAKFGEHILRAHQDLIGLRRRHPWLTHATTEPITVESRRYLYRSTSADGATSLEVEIDLDPTPKTTVRDASGAVLWEQS